MKRRDILIGSALFALKPSFAMPQTTLELVQKFTGGKPLKSGLVVIELNELVDNGNSVSIRVKVNHPNIKRIALFNEKNPQGDIGIFTLSPLSGKAEVATRIRLATTQYIHAVAETGDGLYYHAAAETIVTLAACLED
jgi:sulfur-oxidizing protein SoxY